MTYLFNHILVIYNYIIIYINIRINKMNAPNVQLSIVKNVMNKSVPNAS